VTAPGPGDGPFRILFVCTSNVCRSVLAERLAQAGLRARLGDAAAPFVVRSAGTAGRPGTSLHPYTALALRRLGAPAGRFASRRLTAACLDVADLILCAGREHLDLVVAARPTASRRAYLLKEFARLAASAAPPDGSASPAGRARGVVTQAARLRGRVPYVEPAVDEIGDPKPTQEGFARCANVIHGAVGVVLDSLCGSPS
jgi:low molecular weight protein-tyrosine phosphatase